MREAPRGGHRAKNGKCSGSLAKRMQTMLVKAGHPHVPTVSPCGVEQAEKPQAEPARSSGLPHTSHALGSGGIAEAEEYEGAVSPRAARASSPATTPTKWACISLWASAPAYAGW